MKHFVYPVGQHMYYKMIHGPYNINSVEYFSACSCPILIRRTRITFAGTWRLDLLRPRQTPYEFIFIVRNSLYCRFSSTVENNLIYIYIYTLLLEALRYKPEGRGFDSRWCYWNFSLT